MNLSLIFAIDAPVCAITDLAVDSSSLSSWIVFARDGQTDSANQVATQRHIVIYVL